MPHTVMHKPVCQNFTATLDRRGPNGAWTHVTVPFSVEDVFGSRAMIPVTGTMNGFPFRTSVMPRGDGTHYFAATKAMMAGAGAGPGQRVEITLAPDTEPREVELPEELLMRLDPPTRAYLEGLSYTHRKEYAEWIGSAKRPETRERRLAKAVDMLMARSVLNR